MNKLKRSTYQVLVALGLIGFASLANATSSPPDFSSLTSAVDFSTTTSAIMTVFSNLAVVYIVIKGGGLILGRIRGR